MKRLIWLLPTWIHELIYRVTGWRLVMISVEGTNRITYTWTRIYPL